MSGDGFARRQEIEDVIAALVPGEVVSYGDVASTAGHPGRARLVGRVLAGSEGLPWWRVVDAGGRLVPGEEELHRDLLVAEGVVVESGRVRRSPLGRFALDRQPGRDTET
ncbi:MAG: MGMT family protein [Ilumatobacteraceae bacterium]